MRNQEEIFGRLATLENNSNMYAPSHRRPQPIQIPPPPMLNSSLDISFDSPGGPIAPSSGPPAYIPLSSTPRQSPPLCLDENDYLGHDALGMKILKQILFYLTIIHHLAIRTTLKIVPQLESLEYVLPSVTCFYLPATLSVLSNRTIPLIRLSELELASAPELHQTEKLPPSNCPHQKSTKANCCRQQQSFISIRSCL